MTSQPCEINVFLTCFATCGRALAWWEITLRRLKFQFLTIAIDIFPVVGNECIRHWHIGRLVRISVCGYRTFNTTLNEHQILVCAICLSNHAPLMEFYACESDAVEYLQEIASNFK